MSFFSDKMQVSEVIAQLRELESNHGPTWTNVVDFEINTDYGYRYVAFYLAASSTEEDLKTSLPDQAIPAWSLADSLEYELTLYGDLPTNVWTVEEDEELGQFRYIRVDATRGEGFEYELTDHDDYDDDYSSDDDD